MEELCSYKRITEPIVGEEQEFREGRVYTEQSFALKPVVANNLEKIMSRLWI